MPKKKEKGEFLLKCKKFFPELSKNPRPYWYVDLKWVSMLLFIGFFVSALLSFNFSQIISKKNVVDQMTTNIADSLKTKLTDFFTLSQQFLNVNRFYVKDILIQAKDQLTKISDEAKQKAQVSRLGQGEKVQPIQGLNFYIEKNQIDKYSNEVESAVFSQIASSIDNLIGQGLDQSTDLQQWENQLVEKIQFPKIYDQKLHTKYVIISSVLFFISFILFLAIIFFSFGWWRIFNPGLAILISGVPGFYLLNRVHDYLIHSTLKNLADNSNFIVQLFAKAIYDAFNQQVNSLYLVYKVLLVLGLIMVVAGLAGKIYQVIKKKKKTKK